MSRRHSSPLSVRLEKLEQHLEEENPILLEAVQSFRVLDRVAYRLGLLERGDSFATRVPWWPLISVLGTFSSGKSTFINTYLGQGLQATGNQAVDDKFTVICYSADPSPRLLPGLALDADPRFPFYQISYDIDEVASGEGRRVDAYLQLKTCASARLRGKILIDSPGFDADAQRTSTLRLSSHIVDLSDLVLVFFDARHPEPGAMQDTLQHLVAETIGRPDSNKFLYILNQIDSAAREDNPEEVFASWQRALANKGLTAGRFYRIYDAEAAAPIENESRRRRFESKRDEDLAAIYARVEQVEVERAYRVIGVLEKLARAIERDYVPALQAAKARWRRATLIGDGAALGAAAVGALVLSLYLGYWDGLAFTPPEAFTARPWLGWATLAAVVAVAVLAHVRIRRVAARMAARGLRRAIAGHPHLEEAREQLERAFAKNTRWWSPVLQTRPIGWSPMSRRRLTRALSDADRYVQQLNDQFTDPSGHRAPGPAAAPAGAAPEQADRDEAGAPPVATESYRPG